MKIFKFTRTQIVETKHNEETSSVHTVLSLNIMLRVEAFKSVFDQRCTSILCKNLLPLVRS